MKAAAVAAIAIGFAGTATAADYARPVLRVIDGDTVAVDAWPDLPPELARLKIRLRGVDTPEKGRRAKCRSECAAGQAATAFAKADKATASFRRCRREGETVRKPIDRLIAAVAIRAEVSVLHRDGDFDVPARHTALEIAG